MTDATDIVYAGTSIFIDFPMSGQTIPGTMTCVAKLLSKDGTVLLTSTANKDTDNTKFELRIPYTDTVDKKGTLTTLLVQVTDTASGYSDVIYSKEISWK